MPCYHPMKAYVRPGLNGKREILFVDSNDILPYERDGHLYLERLEIPCGQCIGCRLEYSRQWAIRCVKEAEHWSKLGRKNYFVTLTFSDEHLPAPLPRIDFDTGEYLGDFDRSPLDKSLLSKFLKDLRAYCKYHFDFQGIRFYGCGEYGSKNGRPHYHCILFNCPDLQLYDYRQPSDFVRKHKYEYFNSNVIDKVWKFGYAVLGDVNFETCAYVARYVMKKHKGKSASFYAENGLVPEFTVCSRRPGIGRFFYDENKDTIYEHDSFPVLVKGNPKYLRPPAYYDRLFDIDDPDRMQQLKEQRKLSAENISAQRRERSSLSDREYLEQSEKNKIAQISRLSRMNADVNGF